MAWRIGVDIGGTFTDVALVDEASGRIGVAKVPTTPRDLAEGVLSRSEMAMHRYGVAAAEVGLLSHATTVVTNAILEEKGARAALITTRGFRDVLELRRSARADLYDLFQDAPATLIPRRRRFEITERVGADGAVVTPLAEDEIDALIAALKEARVEAVAVALLFSFLNPEHERRLGARLRAALPGVPVYLSSEVLPEIKEFERTSTTAVCAYVGPILASYLERLRAAPPAAAALPPLYLMGSNGGMLEAAEAVAMPALAVESGPAAGVVAAALVARQTGRLDLLSFDMGGTTAKASLIRAGQYETTPDYEVGGGSSMSRWMHGTGHPIRVPVIDLAEVSAGGGSIAWVDRAGALRVGPKSAGAEPGPVCYGRGGAEPTVTDCNLLLGYLDQGSLLGGRPADRPCGGRGRDPRTAGRAARRRCPQRRGGRHRRRQPRHGGSPEDRVGAARPRPARFRAGRIRRGRAPARGRARRRARHRRGHLSADPGRVLGARPGRHRPEARLRAHALHHHRDRRSGRRRSRLRGARARGRRHARSRRRRARAAALRALGRCALRAAVLRAGECRFRRARSTRPRSTRSPRASTTAIGTPMATTTAASRCRSSACALRRSARSRRSRSATCRRRAGTDAVKARRRSGSAKPARSRRRSTIASRMPAGLAGAGPAVIEVARSRPSLSHPAGRLGWTSDGFVLLTSSRQMRGARLDRKQKDRRAAPIPPPSRSSRTASTRSPRRCGWSWPRPPTRRS